MSQSFLEEDPVLPELPQSYFDRGAADTLRPCWEVMGKTIVYQGGPGAGQHTKVVNQVLVAGAMIGVCEALLYATRRGWTCPRCWRFLAMAQRVIIDTDPGIDDALALLLAL